MSKFETIDRIRQVNRSVDEAFLLDFDENQLETYLRRLTELSGHRGPQTAWIRAGDTMAIVTRRRPAA